MLIYGSFTLRRLFDSMFAYFWFNGVLHFSLNNLFYRKVFLISSCLRCEMVPGYQINLMYLQYLENGLGYQVETLSIRLGYQVEAFKC